MSRVISKAFKTLKLEAPSSGVLHVSLNRPENFNAVNPQMWLDLKACFEQIKMDNDVNAVVLSGTGKNFCAGLDLKEGLPITSGLEQPTETPRDVARKGYYNHMMVLELQKSISAIEECSKPVLCAIDNACIGAGVDIATSCDIRYCTKDAFFSIKEVDIGMAADVGTLQRLPKVVGNISWARELAFTARKALADEALQFGLVSRIFNDKKELLDFTLKMAADIAGKSPVAVTSTKTVLNYSRDHSVQDGLNHVALWNTLMHNTNDVNSAITAFLKKKSPKFSKL
ncbi:Delta(3,5)-Delta(2,4)-dienoyl-CoA isomerase, mitochondrial [Smittium culicis]|uniref:Delta(3,5)-Delta(2,4)-dienoyl-CoA isomerase, mitochondrial n=1 Tax=Smittium culicis TaxID=133412 RepID=A0A1R1XPH6_9FUNG|nr:Delta(3,5)-Delta(2,4)-dienoyl-CoA isomerase, mitochondrial [Smittium culicis]OMJ19834.1 Delta(3,5)-Delta(2,4)-dienoyl-CoA isomerase, mitochondrial [Smittium culicis]